MGRGSVSTGTKRGHTSSSHPGYNNSQPYGSAEFIHSLLILDICTSLYIYYIYYIYYIIVIREEEAF